MCRGKDSIEILTVVIHAPPFTSHLITISHTLPKTSLLKTHFYKSDFTRLTLALDLIHLMYNPVDNYLDPWSPNENAHNEVCSRSLINSTGLSVKYRKSYSVVEMSRLFVSGRKY